jgi:hypothetical protein
MVRFNFYRAEEFWYLRIVRASDNAVYDVTAGGLSAGPSYAASVITLVWDAVVGAYLVEIPELPVDDYDLCFYNYEVPADTDVVTYGQEHRVV